MKVFLESLTSEFEKGINTIDTFCVIACNQYSLDISNAETMLLSESVDNDQYEYLCEEAEKSLKEKSSKAVESVKSLIEKLCSSISEKLKGSKEGLDECEA